MDDSAFVAAFEDCTLPTTLFRHREHLRLAWLYLRDLPYDEAALRMEQSIRRYAAHHGASDKYHHTVTMLWMRLIAAARDETPGASTFEAFIAAHPDLLDKETPRRFYSAQRFASVEARTRWVEPDLAALKKP
jgi:hypothetical protein